MTPQWLPAWAEQRDTAEKQEENLGTLHESQGLSFITTSPRETNYVFSLRDPKSKWIYSPLQKKKKENVQRDNRTERGKKIPVISRLEQAVNINNRNVQVESVGWRFPRALWATWGIHASVHAPARGASLLPNPCHCVCIYQTPVLFSRYLCCYTPPHPPLLIWTPCAGRAD